jgi:hypothetical protein
MAHVKEVLNTIMLGFRRDRFGYTHSAAVRTTTYSRTLVCGVCGCRYLPVFPPAGDGGSRRILYVVLPSLAAGIAGYSWGGAILDPSRVQNYGQTVLRGFIVAAGTFVIFAAFYACGLPALEGQWSLGRVGSLFLLTLMLGILTGGPLAGVTGTTAAVTLFRFGRHFFSESGGRVSETSIV